MLLDQHFCKSVLEKRHINKEGRWLIFQFFTLDVLSFNCCLSVDTCHSMEDARHLAKTELSRKKLGLKNV